MENKPKEKKPRKKVVPVKQKPVDVVAIVEKETEQPKAFSSETTTTVLPFDKAWDAAIAYNYYLDFMKEKKAKADAKIAEAEKVFDAAWDAAHKEKAWREKRAAQERSIEAARKPYIAKQKNALAHLRGSFKF